MTARAPALLVVLMSACSFDGAGSGTGFRRREVHPEVVAPEVHAARTRAAAIEPPVLTPVSLIPPIVRGPRQIEAFRQENAKVDVLWIVDNSASLSAGRARLASQFSNFLQVLLAAGVDFHVGVTSTDLGSTGDGGRLRGPVPWIDRSTRDPESAFRAALSFPDDREVALEQGLLAMERALSASNLGGANRGFLRDDAALAVIGVSDEDDQSIGPVTHYARFLGGLKEPGREANLSFSAVVGELPDGCVPAGEENIFGAEADAGRRYLELAQTTAGLVESICSPDFGPFVEALAIALSGLRRFFPLSAPPIEDTIEVQVDGRVVPHDPVNGWTYRAAQRAVELNGRSVPPPGAEVRITYDVAL